MSPKISSLSKHWLFGLLATVVFLAGCGRGDGLTRVPVSGGVTYRGEPVTDGQIRFTPEADTAGPVTIEPIVGGHYECTHNGGLPVGTHRVAILSWDPNTPEPKGPGAPPRKQFLPPKYNRQTELVWTLEGQPDSVIKNFDLD